MSSTFNFIAVLIFGITLGTVFHASISSNVSLAYSKISSWS